MDFVRQPIRPDCTCCVESSIAPTPSSNRDNTDFTSGQLRRGSPLPQLVDRFCSIGVPILVVPPGPISRNDSHIFGVFTFPLTHLLTSLLHIPLPIIPLPLIPLRIFPRCFEHPPK